MTVEQKLFYIALGFCIAAWLYAWKPRKEARKPELSIADKRLA